jgi:hypothetical protein
MKRSSAAALSWLVLSGLAAAARAENDAVEKAAPRPATQPASPQIPIKPIESADAAAPVNSGSADGKEKVRFSSEASWETAGYNNDEIVYTILVRNEDTRILRCSVQIKGSYIEKGRSQTIEDRQLATVFPDQKTQVGNWMGMDPLAGATYTVGCRAL